MNATTLVWTAATLFACLACTSAQASVAGTADATFGNTVATAQCEPVTQEIPPQLHTECLPASAAAREPGPAPELA